MSFSLLQHKLTWKCLESKHFYLKTLWLYYFIFQIIYVLTTFVNFFLNILSPLFCQWRWLSKRVNETYCCCHFSHIVVFFVTANQAGYERQSVVRRVEGTSLVPGKNRKKITLVRINVVTYLHLQSKNENKWGTFRNKKINKWKTQKMQNIMSFIWHKQTSWETNHKVVSCFNLNLSWRWIQPDTIVKKSETGIPLFTQSKTYKN